MKKTISNEETATLCWELSKLLRKSTPMQALALLAEEDSQQGLLSELSGYVDDGMTLSDALEKSGAFPGYVCGLVKVGEESGQTAEALSALSQHYEDRVRLNRRVRSALLYPAVMLLLMLVVIGVLLVKVLPIFNDVYASLGGSLTGVAGGLLTLGRWLDRIMPVLWVVLAVAVVFAAVFAASDSFRSKMGAMWQKNHGDKGISRKLNDARFAQAMSMGMACGKTPLQSVELAVDLMEGGAKTRCKNCQTRLEDGESLGKSLRESGALPAYQCRLLEIGQESGSGKETMEKIYQDLKEESEASLDALVSRVEPALVLVCSILVGLILLSVMLPLMHIMAAIG